MLVTRYERRSHGGRQTQPPRWAVSHVNEPVKSHPRRCVGGTSAQTPVNMSSYLLLANFHLPGTGARAQKKCVSFPSAAATARLLTSGWRKCVVCVWGAKVWTVACFRSPSFPAGSLLWCNDASQLFFFLHLWRGKNSTAMTWINKPQARVLVRTVRLMVTVSVTKLILHFNAFLLNWQYKKWQNNC